MGEQYLSYTEPCSRASVHSFGMVGISKCRQMLIGLLKWPLLLPHGSRSVSLLSRTPYHVNQKILWNCIDYIFQTFSVFHPLLIWFKKKYDIKLWKVMIFIALILKLCTGHFTEINLYTIFIYTSQLLVCIVRATAVWIFTRWSDVYVCRWICFFIPNLFRPAIGVCWQGVSDR